MQIGAAGGLHGLLVPRRALGLGHVVHEVGVRVLARMRLEVRPCRVECLVAAPELGQEVALEPAEVVVGE